MKLAFNVSVVSSKSLAALVWVLTATLAIVGWPLPTDIGRLFLVAVGVMLGTLFASQRLWLLRYPADEVLEQIQNTLQMCGVGYEVIDRSVKVTATGTRATVRGCGPLSLVSFEVLNPKCNKERFLLEALVKYLRFTGRKDHG